MDFQFMSIAKDKPWIPGKMKQSYFYNLLFLHFNALKKEQTECLPHTSVAVPLTIPKTEGSKTQESQDNNTHPLGIHTQHLSSSSLLFWLGRGLKEAGQ